MFDHMVFQHSAVVPVQYVDYGLLISSESHSWLKIRQEDTSHAQVGRNWRAHLMMSGHQAWCTHPMFRHVSDF